MTAPIIALFFGAGVAGWIYTILARNSGNADPKSTYFGAGIAGFIAFVFFLTLLKFVLHIG